MKTLKNIGMATFFVLLFSALSNTTNSYGQLVMCANPAWAPAYYPGVRYYYITDLEIYYDLSNQDFVYLDDGQWMFSQGLPSMYAGFDLFGCFVVALGLNVYQPWMHQQFYIANYPRYYYRSVYNNDEIANIRGFNENERQPVSYTEADKARTNEVRANTQMRSGNSRHCRSLIIMAKISEGL